MTTRDDFDRHLSAWLDATAPPREPELLLETVLARTARTRRRPAWLIPERWIPMSVITSRVAMPTRAPWRTVGIVALLILALAVGAILVAGSRERALPAPFGPAVNGPIVYPQGGALYTRATLDSPPTLLKDGSDLIAAFYSPRGDRMAYLQSGDPGGSMLWVADPDGSHAIKLGGPFLHDDWYEWSPDGSLIAVQSDIGQLPTISLIRTDGSGGRILDLGDMAAGTPTFRPPDGRQLLIRGLTHGEIGMDWAFFLVNLDGSGLTRLDLDPGSTNDAYYDENRDFYFEEPAWSPDGTRISFHTLEPAQPDPGFRIHVASIGDAGAVSDERILEYDHGSRDEFKAAWLPTGDGLVFESLSPTDVRIRTGVPEIGAVAHDIGTPLATSSFTTFDIRYALSPDGSLVVAHVDGPQGTGPRPLWASDVATGQQTRNLFEASDLVSWQRLAR